ncbi:cbl-interacting serine/threonine-protein kinase 8 [Anaeramoeba ignava]|uniref:non-specific serine/threonine protein kinase n=1 Tax=Anaeramoeba ignava TaxID=1746090 RepID=A0A9Q0LG98_ANAIG|nr:cbl-interacting serine/threonine-protein kinase 8 [Anaeramoeba ignava]
MSNRIGPYEIGKTLGEGTFGKVKQAVNVETNELVAIKVMEKKKILKENMAEQVKKEISVMKMINHPHIVRLIDVLVSKSRIFLVLELVTGGELFYKIAHDGKFDDHTSRYYFQQLITGVEFCHSQGVVHRDLKPENILLDSKNNIKISDFGLSALRSETEELLQTACGTPNYVAPEVLDGHGYDGKIADIWSCGVILYVFLAGFLPIDDSNLEKLFVKIKNAEIVYPSWFSPHSVSLLKKILVANPTKRATIQQIKQDPWFRIGYQPFHRIRAVSHIENFFKTQQKTNTDEKSNANLNAFEIISKSGAFDITRLLHKNPREKIFSYTRFTSKTKPEEIFQHLTKIFEQNPEAQIKIKKEKFKIKAHIKPQDSHPFEIHVQIFSLVSNLYLVEFTRKTGDYFGFMDLYKKIRDEIAKYIDISGDK